MRQTFVQRDGKWIPKENACPITRDSYPQFMPDIQPYTSTITGEQITSRSKHRAHLKAHNCIEMGDQKPKWMEK